MTQLLSRRAVLGGATALTVAPPLRPSFATTPKVHRVAIKAFAFDPAVVQVRLGDVIEWHNHDLAPHTATANAFGWDTGALDQNEAGAITVTEGMELAYFCAFHPHMKGQIELV